MQVEQDVRDSDRAWTPRRCAAQFSALEYHGPNEDEVASIRFLEGNSKLSGGSYPLSGAGPARPQRRHETAHWPTQRVPFGQ